MNIMVLLFGVNVVVLLLVLLVIVLGVNMVGVWLVMVGVFVVVSILFDRVVFSNRVYRVVWCIGYFLVGVVGWKCGYVGSVLLCCC